MLQVGLSFYRNALRFLYPVTLTKLLWCCCSFNGGFSFGCWCGALASHELQYTAIKALTWKAHTSLRSIGKEGSRAAALDLFPQAAHLLKYARPGENVCACPNHMVAEGPRACDDRKGRPR